MSNTDISVEKALSIFGKGYGTSRGYSLAQWFEARGVVHANPKTVERIVGKKIPAIKDSEIE